jgi:hypothetical protein
MYQFLEGGESRACFRRFGGGGLIQRRIRNGGVEDWRWICGFGGILLEEREGCLGELSESG